MKKEIRIAPMNSLILIMDRTFGDVPKSMNHTVVAATTSCVAIGTIYEFDSETHLSLSDLPPEFENSSILAYEGVLKTPSKRLSVCSVMNDPILECDVQNLQTRIRVFINDDSEPDEIYILILPSSQ
jgi:hypothetical protein